jgi:nicotinate-nucleotide adenylyltransferase
MNPAMTEVTERIALFGGSFDPPHCGHLAIARAARERCRLERVIFIPCRTSPLKGKHPAASGAARMEMLRLAVAGMPWAEVSDCELSRPGPSYSWQTVDFFASQFPAAALQWLMGADQWADLERWARPDFLRDSLTFIVIARAGVEPRARPGWRAVFLSAQSLCSSTEVRRRLAAGESTDGLLPAAVGEYAVRERLYTTEGQ